MVDSLDAILRTVGGGSLVNEFAVPIVLMTGIGVGISELGYHGINALTNDFLSNYQLYTRVIPDVFLGTTGAITGAAAAFLGYNSH